MDTLTVIISDVVIMDYTHDDHFGCHNRGISTVLPRCICRMHGAVIHLEESDRLRSRFLDSSEQIDPVATLMFHLKLKQETT